MVIKIVQLVSNRSQLSPHSEVFPTGQEQETIDHKLKRLFQKLKEKEADTKDISWTLDIQTGKLSC